VALKDLLVYVDETECALERLRLAADLARRHKSHLIALYVEQLSAAQIEQQATDELGLDCAADMRELDRRNDESMAKGAERMRLALELLAQEKSIDTEWRCLKGIASVLVPQHARHADLCILDHELAVDVNPAGYSFSEQMIFVTGRPVLFVPVTGHFETLGRRLLVAWNSSRVSARALHDALPLIERAEHTTVLMVNPAKFINRHGALPPKQMLEHLRRHDATVEGIEIGDVPADSIANVIQAEAHKVGADLTVAGAFGHPRLWEKALGGVTRELLAHMDMPTLMSH